jgi:hypothetical protein
LGFTDVETLPWQVDYDQVFAKKLFREGEETAA